MHVKLLTEHHLVFLSLKGACTGGVDPDQLASRPTLFSRQDIYMRFRYIDEISNNVVSATSKASDQPVHMRSLIRAFASGLNIL